MSSGNHSIPTYFNYIGGRWKASVTGELEASVNPARRSDIVGHVQRSSRDDLDEAAWSARAALKSWKRLAGSERGHYLFQAADALERRLEEIATTMTREMGKTLPEARGETARGVAILRYYAGEGMRANGDVIPSADSEALMFTTRVPLGVVGIITPWNFPVAIPLWKLAPALIYGNTVVLKPATETAVTCAKLVECLAEAGLPAGVVNMVAGPGAVIGQGIAEHPDIHGLSFTGSNAVGKAIGQAALARGAKYQLEMGGKNPLIVAADADLALAVEAAISGGLRSTGQKCTATSRIIVHRDVYEPFTELLLGRIAAIKVGDGLEEGVWMGPSANENQMRTVLEHIRQAEAEGAKLLCGGKRLEGAGYEDGWFVEPTVFAEVTPEMTIAREEIFGPVLALLKADSLEEALELANDVPYGLSASIFTANIGGMLAFIRDIDAGLVRINAESAGVELQAPFGGMKQSSSHSREQGRAAIEFYTSVKTVFVKA